MSAAIPRPGVFGRIWSSYLNQLSARPLTTKMTTSGAMFMLGDTIAQFGIEGRKLPLGDSDLDTDKDSRWDATRPLRLGIYGAFVFAPLAHTWLGVMERIRLGSPLKTLATRISLDAALWGPFIVSMFWSSTALLEGKSVKETRQKVEMAFFPAWSKSVFVFVPTQIINQTLIPIQHRLLVLQTVGLGWNIFLSYQNNINNHRLAEAALLLQQATLQAEDLNLPLTSLSTPTRMVDAATPLTKEQLKVTNELQEAKKKVEEGLKRRKEIRGEEGGGALGVGTRMGWS